ncbi:antibiotic biosynthesis monooxygenase family protein [Sphingomonas sp. TX0543]|uniref:antibiotic biosynthesis monooxygenase family protein n=1 Tax=unclassified Sphingomonas TaxID=196159 RepID=UPI0010F87FC9|nr:antibiotic biosynthesis monooxygenase [Sphingomonas sp. 3P27F8]
MHDGTSVGREGQVAVIFISQRTAANEEEYAAAAAAMDALAAAQPGYRGVDAVRDADGRGITISYWANEADAIAWREHPDHAATRARGRADWYLGYQVIVARVERGYDWMRS